MSLTPMELANARSLSVLCRALTKTSGERHDRYLKAIQILLDRLWHPFE